MAQPNYLEPIEKEDLDIKKKFTGSDTAKIINTSQEGAAEEKKEISVPQPEKVPGQETVNLEKDTSIEPQEEKVSEQLENARRTISTQKPSSAAAISDDAKTISEITEYEKKVEKLMEIALQKGPEHAIRVAQHLDKGKDISQADNYTMDSIHDHLLEDNLRNQLIAKGFLKEL
jgi:hypothetical protein